MKYCKHCNISITGKNVNFCSMACQARWINENGYVFGVTMDHRAKQEENAQIYQRAQKGDIEARSYLRRELRVKSIYVPGRGQIKLRAEVRE